MKFWEREIEGHNLVEEHFYTLRGTFKPHPRYAYFVIIQIPITGISKESFGCNWFNLQIIQYL